MESGTEFTLEFGDIDAPFYESLESAMELAVKLLYQVEPAVKEKYRSRFKRLMDKTFGKIGWGYGDHLADVFYQHFEVEDGE